MSGETELRCPKCGYPLSDFDRTETGACWSCGVRFREEPGFAPVPHPVRGSDRWERPFHIARFLYALFAPCAVAFVIGAYGRSAQARLPWLAATMPFQLFALAAVSVASACYCGILLGRGKNWIGIVLSMLLSLFLIVINLLATVAAGCSLG